MKGRLGRLYYAVPDRIVGHSDARVRRAVNFWFTVVWLFPGSLVWWELKNDLWFVGFLSIWALWISHWTAFAAETPFEDEDSALDQATAAQTQKLLTSHGVILERLAEADESDRTLLEALAVALETQQHIADTLVELAHSDVAISEEIRDRHVENQKMIRDGLALIEKLYRATLPVQVAAEAAVGKDGDGKGSGGRAGARLGKGGGGGAK